MSSIALTFSHDSRVRLLRSRRVGAADVQSIRSARHARGRKENRRARACRSVEERLDDGRRDRRSPGDLVYFERMDNTQLGSVNTAILKARSSARFKRPTKSFQDMVASGGEGLRALGLDGAMVVEGGVPLVMDGKIVGAVGASGGTSAQDGQCAKAAAASVK